MSSIFGNETSSLNIEEEITLDSGNYVNNAQSVSESIIILDNQLYHPPTLNLPQTEHNECLDFLAEYVQNVATNITPLEIKNKYELNDDTNAYTDNEKLLVATIPDKIEIDVNNLTNYQTTTTVNNLLAQKVSLSQLDDYTTTLDQLTIDQLQDDAINSKYDASNPANFINNTVSDLTNYTTTTNNNALLLDKYDASNPADYQSGAQVTSSIAATAKSSTEIIHSYSTGPPIIGAYIANELANDVNFLRVNPLATNPQPDRAIDFPGVITGSASFNDKTIYTTATNSYLIEANNAITTIPFIVNGIQRGKPTAPFYGVGSSNFDFVYYLPATGFDTYTFASTIQATHFDEFLPAYYVLLSNGEIWLNDSDDVLPGGWVLRGTVVNTKGIFTTRTDEIIYIIADNGDISSTTNFIAYASYTNIGTITNVKEIKELSDNVIIVNFYNGAVLNQAKLVLNSPGSTTVSVISPETKIVKLQDNILSILSNNLYATKTYDIFGFNFSSDSFVINNLNTNYFRLIYEYTSSQTSIITVGGVDTVNQLETNLEIITELNNKAYASDVANSLSLKYDASNPSNYITSSALTPYETILNNNAKMALKYDSSNPSNFITSGSLSPYELTTSVNTKLLDFTKFETMMISTLAGNPSNGTSTVWGTSWNTTIKTYLCPKNMVIDTLFIICRLSAGTGSATYTLFKNGVATTLVATFTNNAVQQIINSPVSFSAGDTYYITHNRAGITHTDIQVGVLIRY